MELHVAPFVHTSFFFPFPFLIFPCYGAHFILFLLLLFCLKKDIWLFIQLTSFPTTIHLVARLGLKKNIQNKYVYHRVEMGAITSTK